MSNMTDKTWSDDKEAAQALPIENADASGAKGKKKKEKKVKEKKIKAEKVKEPMDKAKKKKVIRRCIFGGIAAVIVLFIIVSKVMAANAGMPVMTVTAEHGDVEEVLNTSGTIASELSKTYFSPVNAKVSTLGAAVGDEVAEGTVIVAYDTESLELEKEKAALQAQASENNYKGAMSDSAKNAQKYNEAVNNIGILDLQIAAQKQYVQDLEYALEDEVSAKRVDLYAWGATLQKELEYQNSELATMAPGSEDYEDTQKIISNISAQITANQNEIALMDDNKALTEKEREVLAQKEILADYEEYKAEMEAQKTSSEAGKLNGYTQKELAANSEVSKLSQELAEKNLQTAADGIKADFTGIVTELNVVEGSPATEGMQLLKLESSEKVKITISVSKYDLEKIETGQSVDITIAGNAYEGTVAKINRMAVTGASGTPIVGAEIHINNPDDKIILGTEAKVNIHTGSAADVVRVPVETINADKEGDFCYIVEDGIVVKRRLTTGISSDSHIEVVEGLKEGDIVISSMNSAITEGMKVTPIPAEAGGMTITPLPVQ